MKNGALIFGIIFSVLGLGIAGTSAYFAKEDLKKLDKYEEKSHVVIADSQKLEVECDAGTINIHHTTGSESYVDYKVLETYEVKIEEGKVELKRKWQYWFMPFFGANSTVVDVYLADKDYDMELDLNAGKMNLDEGFTFNTLNITVSAGEFKSKGDLTVNNYATFKVSAGELKLVGNTTVTNKAELKVSAGDLDVDNLTAGVVYTGISAGDIKCKVKSDDITFKISAGDLKMDIVGELEDYKTTIKKSAGSCNIKENASGSKKLDGKISAGKATINFVSE